MCKITLICSVHAANGLCNSGELLKILQAIEPEVVFEEIRPSDFDSYYQRGTITTLETQAVSKYAKLKSFQQVPVDHYDTSNNLIVEFKNEMDSVFACVEQASQEYLELKEEQHIGVYQHGFAYLNSAAFETIQARICEIEISTIAGTGDQGMIGGLKRWRQFSQRREIEMVGNIYNYCRENVFDTGVFLVGAAHKTGIVKEIERHASTETTIVDWKFLHDGEISWSAI